MTDFEALRRDPHLADYQCEVLMGRIKDFEDSLDDDHEAVLKLTAFGQSITLAVTDIEYSNPYLLVFHGSTDTGPATLIQSVSQLNFLIQAVPKADPKKPARRVGFDLSAGTQGNQS